MEQEEEEKEDDEEDKEKEECDDEPWNANNDLEIEMVDYK